MKEWGEHIEKNGLFKEILDNLNDGVYFIDSERRITYWSRGAELLTGFSSSEVLGKRCMDNILSHTSADGLDLCVGGCPSAMSILDGRPREVEVFLHHKEGHRVPVLSRVIPMRGPDGAIVGAVEVFKDSSAAIADRERIEELRKLAMLDQLTEIGNRRCAEIHLSHKLAELERYGWPMGVIFMDIDHFKAVNDSHGHDMGDRVLKATAGTLVRSVRSVDTVYRWGGEEFLAIISNVDQDILASLTEKLRRLVERSTVAIGPETVGVTISAGATLGKYGDTTESIVKRADQLMYLSKRSGRNSVTIK